MPRLAWCSLSAVFAATLGAASVVGPEVERSGAPPNPQKSQIRYRLTGLTTFNASAETTRRLGIIAWASDEDNGIMLLAGLGRNGRVLSVDLYDRRTPYLLKATSILPKPTQKTFDCAVRRPVAESPLPNPMRQRLYAAKNDLEKQTSAMTRVVDDADCARKQVACYLAITAALETGGLAVPVAFLACADWLDNCADLPPWWVVNACELYPDDGFCQELCEDSSSLSWCPGAEDPAPTDTTGAGTDTTSAGGAGGQPPEKPSFLDLEPPGGWGHTCYWTWGAEWYTHEEGTVTIHADRDMECL